MRRVRVKGSTVKISNQGQLLPCYSWQSRGQVKKKGYEKRQLPYVPFTPEPSLSKRVLELNCYNCPVMMSILTFKMEDHWGKTKFQKEKLLLN